MTIRLSTGALGVVLGLHAGAQELTRDHEQCDIHINASNAATCVLHHAATSLKCDRSVGQPRPQCITQEGRFADCLYRELTPGEPPAIFCSARSLAASDAGNANNRIVITDERFGGPREIVRVQRGAPVAQVDAAAGVRRRASQGRSDSDESYRTAVRECSDAWSKIVGQATQSPNDRGGVVISMARYMERACTPPRGLRLDDAQRRSYCDSATNYVHNLAEQSPKDRESIRSALRGVLTRACSK
jgi:hypothetical protein